MPPPSLLGDKKMPAGEARAMPGLGIPGRGIMLVHQRHRLRVQGAKKLERENEYLPGL